ncbi:KilA-N domain-containing protein [Marinomonas atlantica]|uniref:KilA-N domain-containing protein n=1 Tax=Marinomonas atlantica TaxID=1806668 RepID=UPI0008346861|nr:KilA-N domain-containing protein [Marinomonas atlantica]
MAKLSILSNEVRVSDGLYSLNDLHKASGSKNNHRPSLFVRTEQTKELIEEITQSTDMCLAIKTRKGGSNPGTWVCKELVYAYAMWISPKFHLYVIRAFDQMVSQPQPKQLSSTTDRKALNICVRSLANARSHNNEPADYASVWKMVNGYLGVAHIEEATVDQVEKGIEFIQQAIEGEYIGRNDQKLIEDDRVGQLEKRIAVLELTQSRLESELSFIHNHAAKLSDELNEKVYPALKALNPKVFATVRERMFIIHNHSKPAIVDGWKNQSALEIH